MSDQQVISGLYNPIFHTNWKKENLYSLATWNNGLAFKNINFSDSGIPVIKISEIKNGKSSQTKYTQGNYDLKYWLTNGDMLFCWSGQPETSIGTYWWRQGDGWLNQHIFKVHADEKNISQKFLYQLLQYLRPTFVRIARNKQTTGLGHITKQDLKQIFVGVPEIHEQRGIAATLGALDDKIESNRRIARLAEEIILAYFEKYFDISGQENGIAISNLIAVNPKYRLKKGVEAIKISMADLPENSAIISTWNKEIVAGGQRFTNGDVLFARITPCLENGKTSIVDMLDDDSVGFGSTEFIVLSPKGNIKTAWIYAFARNKSVRTWAARNMTGTSGRQRFQASFFDGYLISPPSEKMIENFNLIANPFTQKLTQIRDENLKLESLRDALLPELMSGRICVPEAQEAIAEVIPEEDDEHASKTSRG